MKYCSPEMWERVANTTHLKTAENPMTIVIKSESVTFQDGKINPLTVTCTKESLANELHNLKIFLNDFTAGYSSLTLYACTPAGGIVEMNLYELPEDDLAAMCIAMLFTPLTAKTTSCF